MKKTHFPVLLAAASLAGCSYLFPEDSRLGEEPAEACKARLASSMALLDFRNVEDQSATLVPTYTFDITLMDFTAKQALIEPGADETLGTRLIKQTNEISTARAQFMSARVDEKGAFFFGPKPHLWRVRGEAMPYEEIVEAGCARQISNMRLTHVDLTATEPQPEPEPGPDAPETDQSGETTQ